jgi:SAM-dependent methyltransferase
VVALREAIEGADTREEVFDRIFDQNLWQAKESRSGAGSSIKVTSLLRRSLSTIIGAYNVRTVVDVGCGDYNWMQHVVGDLGYLGIDISPKVIEFCKDNHEDDTPRFVVYDPSRRGLIKWSPDLVIIRDVLVHLSNKEAGTILDAALSWRPRLLAITHFPIDKNLETETPIWRPTAMNRPPFNLPDPDLLLTDEVHKYKCLGVWVRGKELISAG